MRELWANVLHTSGARIYSLVIGVVTLFLTARLLGPEGRGQVATITTWVGMFSTFAYLSLGQVALHRMASDAQKTGLGRLFGSLLLIASILTVIGWFVAGMLYLFDPKGTFHQLPALPFLIGFLSLPFLIWEQYGSSLLIGLERIRIYNRNQILGRTVAIIAVFLLVGGLNLGVSGVLGAMLVGQVIVAMAGIGFLFSSVRERELSCRPDKREIKALLTYGVKLHPNAIGTFLITSSNILILHHYHGAEQTGYFQLASQLVGVLMIFPQAANMVIFGKVATLGPDGAWPYNRRLLMQMTLGMIVLGVVAAVLAPWAIIFLAGKAFEPAVRPFQWMLLGLVGMTFATVMTPQWIGRGYFWQAAVLSVGIGGINLAINLWLIPKWGMQGAVCAFIGTYAISIVCNGVMAWLCQNRFARTSIS